MTEALNNFQSRLDVLRSVYRQQLPERIEPIEATWNRFIASNKDENYCQIARDRISSLHYLTHRLAGSSASFGFPKIGEAARRLELLFMAILESNDLPTTEEKAQIEVAIAALQEAAQSVLPEQNTFPQIYSLENICTPEVFATPDSNNRLLFLVEDDPVLCQDLALQISCFGYQVNTFQRLSELKKALSVASPAAVIMDIVFPENDLAGTKIVQDIQQGRSQPLPVLFISSRSDLMARLQAVRAGGKAYFPKPIKIAELIDALDKLTSVEATEAYRVLIVEDDAPLAAYYGITLQQVGMETEIVTDPLAIMTHLNDFRPDLILMDMYMPGCNGLELAAVIRQQPAYVGIPIVFLSRETDFNKQLTAIGLGGDDFLTKPIEPHHLIASVMPRVERSRLVRSFMTCDSLTGLLNHTTLKERLVGEVKRASRLNAKLAFAMLDIDRFKSINDTYGHLTGDRVLKSLSRLLKQRLRPSDITGRYGGEEFAVILPDTDGEVAVRVLDEIRIKFSQVRQQADGAEFSVTFSCGIAIYPQQQDSTQLNEAADRALYEAKRQGRDRVILASNSIS
ncbi:MAG: diguanylate cyclase [Oscillatoria sp. PMC 1051.18]|nr:diguanylate cyclase [Oscillatoria sp. PMC 1050.18]MEC5031695.1 diguanylate cyclase [Oscillatoria sp. PMC 1051.18]